MRFCFPNKVKLDLEWYDLSRSSHLVSNLKANEMMSMYLLCHHVRVSDQDHDIPSIDSVRVVNEFQVVFPDDFPRVRPHREIHFCIALDLDAKQISISSYRIAPSEHKELKVQLKDLTDKGFIQPSISHSGALVLFVNKKY